MAGSAAAGGSSGDGVPSDAIPIDGPVRITEPGYYVLTKDIVSKTPGGVIFVEPFTDDVTIDGQGHTITGPGKEVDSTAIAIGEYPGTDTNDITVKDLIVTGFEIGIDIQDTDRGLVSNVKVTHCEWGFNLLENLDLTIADSIVAKNDVAFFQDEGSPRTTFARNRITRNEQVGNFEFADDSVIEDNRVDYNNSRWAFSDSTGLRVVGNLFYQNKAGFEITEFVGRGNESPNVIRGNRFIENEETGVNINGEAVFEISNVLVEENDVLRNGGVGIEFFSILASTISKNRVIGNRGDGVRLINSDDNEVTGNLIRQNVGDGIELRRREEDDSGSNNNVIRNNIIRENGDLPIRIDEFSNDNVVENNQIGDDAPNVCRIPDE
ncbi:right-handed parallel beta-helix repeat-containing protein [Haloferax sp. DFSO52]|uniref:right-handed parallel beta-helix repeat-containing protein n=1 Tax=Haloferax sp. DFSO52 TaxID=3388505 RepID=UPI003A859C67